MLLGTDVEVDASQLGTGEHKMTIKCAIPKFLFLNDEKKVDEK